MTETLKLSLLVVALMLLSAALGWQSGQRSAERVAEREKAQAVARAIKQAEDQAAIDRELLMTAANEAETISASAHSITEEVVRYVAMEPALPAVCALDAFSLCLARAAATGGDPKSCPRKPVAALPKPVPATRAEDGPVADDLRENGWRISPVPEPARVSGQVGEGR
jgi:hypothetical protein